MKRIKRHKYIEDLNQLAQSIAKIHPDPYKYISGSRFNEDLLSIGKDIDISLSRFGISIMISLAKLKDLHTTLCFSEEVLSQLSYPLVLKRFPDGYYLTESLKKNRELLGTKLLKVNGMGVQEVETRFSVLIPNENSTSLKYYFPNKLREPKLLEYFGIVEDDLCSFTFDLDGNEKTIKLKSVKYDVELISLNEFVAEPQETLTVKDKYWTKYYDYCATFYFQYNSCEENDYPTVFDVIKEISELKPRNVIVDLRNNKGGDSDILEPLIEYLETMSAEIRTIIFIGPDTYSSAIINLLSLNKIKNSISIGGIPHGSPTHFGETDKFTLKNTGLTIQTSTKIFEYKGYDHGDVFIPTYEARQTIDDYKRGLDLEMALFKKLFIK